VKTVRRGSGGANLWQRDGETTTAIVEEQRACGVVFSYLRRFGMAGAHQAFQGVLAAPDDAALVVAAGTSARPTHQNTQLLLAAYAPHHHHHTLPLTTTDT
jgi:hypothetical protein